MTDKYTDKGLPETPDSTGPEEDGADDAVPTTTETTEKTIEATETTTKETPA